MPENKDLLEYTREELQQLPIDVLEQMAIDCESKENEYNTRQLAEKLLMNSLYGALANRHFVLFNEEMAAAITGNGRYFIQKLAINIENKLQSLLPNKKQYIIYGDTDSCVGSTIIETNNGKIKIEDLYTSLSGNIEIRSEDNFIKHIITPIKAASVNKDKQLEYNDINYVMKHKVKKRMFKIKCANDEVIITEDHSMIVLRDDVLIEIKPKDVKKTDVLIKLLDKSITEEIDFEIEDLGICEEWVYDIEVEKNHNFFGNNILIHNSIYYQIEPFMNKYREQNPNLTISEYVDWADNFEKKVIQPVIDNTIDEFASELNAYNKSTIGAEREIIADSALFIAKKKYVARVRDAEGVRHPDDEPYVKAMGMEIAKSSTSKWAKKKLKESINIILDKTEQELTQWVQESKNSFFKEDPNNLAQVGSASNLDYDLKTSVGIPFGSRAAICYNEYLKKSGKIDKYTPIQAGDKTKRIFLIEPNPMGTNIISYSSDNFIDEIKDYIDYDTNFEKSFLNPLQLMVDCLNWNLNKKTESLDEW